MITNAVKDDSIDSSAVEDMNIKDMKALVSNVAD